MTGKTRLKLNLYYRIVTYLKEILFAMHCNAHFLHYFYVLTYCIMREKLFSTSCEINIEKTDE